MSVTVTVNGQSGPSVVASTGDTVVANVAAAQAVSVTTSPAAAPGGTGPTGPQGPPSTTITVGDISTLSAGSSATVVGTSSNNGANLTLAFGIPAGAAGATGPTGQTPTITATATTLSAGSSATVSATPSNGGANLALVFGIPRGEDGASGSNLTLSDATPSNLGTASAGTSTNASRSDHTHLLPSLTTLGAAAANHAHPYVTGLNNLTGNLTLAAGSNVSLAVANSTLTISSTGGGITANDSIDGGDYVGEILGGITFSVQPQSQTLTLAGFTLSFSALNVAATGTPSTWLPSGGTFVMNDVATLGAVSFNGSLLANYRRLDANGTQYAAFLSSSDNGATWSEALSLDTHGGFGEGAFDISRKISAASNGTRTLITTGLTRATGSTASNAALVMRRVDGSNLSTATQTTQQYLQVVYLPSAQLFLAIGQSDTEIHRSTDGVTWTTTALGSGGVSAIHVVNGIAVAVGSSGAYRSTNGVQWVFSQVYGEAGAAGYRSSASSATRVVWIDSSGVARYSLDGAVWSVSSSSAFNTGFSHGVTYAAGLFWAVAAASSSTVHTSPDGVTWTARTLPAASRVVDVAAASSVGPVAVLGTVPALATLGGVTTSANLTVSASTSSGNPVSYQWQTSLDAGSTWSNVTNATASTLSLTGLTSANTGTRYRAAASATGAATAFSGSAILTVSG